MTGRDSPEKSVASLLWVVTMLGTERMLMLDFRGEALRASVAARSTVPVVGLRVNVPSLTVTPGRLPEKPTSLLACTVRPRASMPVEAASVSVISAMTTSMRTWASRTSSWAMMSLMRRRSSTVPETTRALLRSSATMVRMVLNCCGADSPPAPGEPASWLRRAWAAARAAACAGFWGLGPKPGWLAAFRALTAFRALAWFWVVWLAARAAVFWPETSVLSTVAISVAVACFRAMTSCRVLDSPTVSSLAMRLSKSACWRGSLRRMIWLVRSSAWNDVPVPSDVALAPVRMLESLVTSSLAVVFWTL